MTAVNVAPLALVSVGDDGAFNFELNEPLRDIWIDRDLSWLDFNERVLAEALDARNPLLERAKFLAIVTANTDEFFMKRMSALRGNSDVDTTSLRSKLKAKMVHIIEEQAKCWKGQIIPALTEQSIFLRHWEELTAVQQNEANQIFDRQISPALTPLIINEADHFPFLSNLSTSLVLTLEDVAANQVLFARVKVPSGLKNWIALKSGANSSEQVFVRLHEIIRGNLGKLYPGMNIGPAALVRLTRDAEVEASHDANVNVRDEIRRQLRQRRFEPVMRLEFTVGVDPAIRELLSTHFELSPDDVYEAPDDLDCSTLFELSGLNNAALVYAPWVPVVPPALREHADIFSVIRIGDVLVHHPYESFDATVERFIDEAARDSQVVAIKMTVYRVGDDTPFVRSLIKAAEAGKQVACVIELKARFDEERNLHWASELEKAGAHVTFGVKGLKIHGKTALVVRKEAEGLRAYAHIGTGNYHSRTARLYADVGLFTCNEEITHDAVSLFHHLTGHSQAPDFTKLLVAPKSMRPGFLALILREIEHQRSGRPARIIAKMNQLEDPEVIEALCQASAAGVLIDLIIRGFCCLKPGVQGRTENIRVFSIIGRFLEHSRIYYFANGADQLLQGDFYIGSADWMQRNLSKRIEVATPVTALATKQRLAEILEICLRDRRQSWVLGSDATYRRRDPDPTVGEDAGAHQVLMNLAAHAN